LVVVIASHHVIGNLVMLHMHYFRHVDSKTLQNHQCSSNASEYIQYDSGTKIILTLLNDLGKLLLVCNILVACA
jgi:hypothetical protein